MWLPRSGSGLLESMLEEPPDTPWSKWGWGVGLPALLTLWGARVMWVQQTVLGMRRRRLELTGSDAWWFGLAILAVAGWIHCHYFWIHQPKLAPYAELGKIVSLIALIVGIGFVLFNQFRLI